MKDFLGNEIEVGDQIVYAVPAGRGQALALYEVVAIGSTTVTARCLETGAYWKPTKNSKLHADLFEYRAVLIKKKEKDNEKNNTGSH